MLYVNMSGGLGNQMFQYAAGRSLASRIGCGLHVVDDMHAVYGLQSKYMLKNIFGIESHEVDKQGMRSVFGWWALPQARRLMSKPSFRWLAREGFVFEPHFHYWPAFRHLTGVRYLHGYWQSARYFEGYESAIRQAFTFPGTLKGDDLAVLELMRQQPSVAVHVRRGDYTNAKNSQVYVQVGREYYQQAIAQMRSAITHSRFFVFSDDPAWVRQHLLTTDTTMVLVDHNSGDKSFNDMRLMSLADHNIIANSTFSWWGAWLNAHPNKQVIAPRNWFLSSSMDSSDVCPADWIKL
jgi:Glycosyl transferase family 11